MADSPRSAVALTITALVAVYSLYSLKPPAPLPADTSSGEFSATRAMDHIRHIAAVPHPPGTKAHDDARDYIVAAFRKLGLDPQVQNTVGVWRRGTYVGGAMVTNLMARLPGTEPGKAVLLVGHYDSVPTGPGAADDGHSVGVLLETARALRGGPRLRHDVIFLLTDGEELGLLGAAGFAAEHPWAKDAAVVLNFEARGTGGPAHMFETSEGNGWLIRQFAKAAPYPMGDSVSYEVYRRLPNDTDLTVFKKYGYPGLNFAFIDDVFFYHTAFDDLAHLDRGSVQQQGSYALSLARQFGDADFSQIKRPDVVYFTAPFHQTVVYSQSLVWPMTLVTAAVFLALVGVGLRKKLLTGWGMLKATLAFLASLAAPPAVAIGLWKLVLILRPPPTGNFIQPYNWRWYEFAFLFAGLAMVALVYTLFRRKTSTADLTAGALLVWLVLLLGCSAVIPLGSYPLAWPLLFTLPAFWALVLRPRRLTVWLCLSGAVAVWMVLPYVDMLVISLTVANASIGLLLLSLLLGLLLPLWLFAAGPRLTLASGGIAALLLAGGLFTAGFTPQHPRPATVAYTLDSATGKALWVSDTLVPDAWTDQFLPAGSQRAEVPKLAPGSAWRQAAAPPLELPPPALEVIDDHSIGSLRSLTLQLSSPRQAHGLVLLPDHPILLRSMKVEGRPVLMDGESAFPLRYFTFLGVPAAGIRVEFECTSRVAFLLHVSDSSEGLPGTHQPRPPNMMRSIFFWPFNETTVVERDFEIPAR